MATKKIEMPCGVVHEVVTSKKKPTMDKKGSAMPKPMPKGKKK